jgi:hypothetical protein
VVKVNADYLKLKAGYLFPEISRRITEFSSKNPNADLIRLGIGDVTEPLPLACREAMKAAIEEMGTEDGFRGYGPEQGYKWLRESISENDYISRGCEISAEEIFVSDGSKCDSSNILGRKEPFSHCHCTRKLPTSRPHIKNANDIQMNERTQVLKPSEAIQFTDELYHRHSLTQRQTTIPIELCSLCEQALTRKARSTTRIQIRTR